MFKGFEEKFPSPICCIRQLLYKHLFFSKNEDRSYMKLSSTHSFAGLKMKLVLIIEASHLPSTPVCLLWPLCWHI